MKKKHLLSLLLVLYPFTIEKAISAQSHTTALSWSGFYAGAKTGAVFSEFQTTSTTTAGPLLGPLQANVINQSGNQNNQLTGFLSGIESGFNWQFNRLLLGLMVDIQALSNDSAQNSGALLDPENTHNQFVLSSYVNNSWLFTARPKLGLLTGNWLFYSTGGLALTLLQSDFIFSTNNGKWESLKTSKVKTGYTVGAGFETRLTEKVSLKTEYLFTQFSATAASTMNQNMPQGQAITSQAAIDENLLNFGFNYYFDSNAISAPSTFSLFNLDQWQTSTGARLLFSYGIQGSPQPLLNSSNTGNTLASRLIFSKLNALTEETFARFDHSSGAFIKGILGAGNVTSGQLNDEDFPAMDAYSNTLSTTKGTLSYGTIDIGYSFLQNSLAKVGVFFGYNYYAQNLKAYNCSQLANDLVCLQSSDFTNFMGISEYDSLDSLRLGLVSQLHLMNRITLNSEAAYLPSVAFNGLDSHNARQLLGPEHASSGDGAMLEASLEYELSTSWNLGIGGRYWMWNMHNGNIIFDFLGNNDGVITEPGRFNTTRYGGFLQVNYRPNELNKEIIDDLIQWDGIFIEGELGGAFTHNQWSDPFGSTPAAEGFINVAGFGNTVQSTGPLGGGDFHINWQKDRIVYGITGSINATDVRGENTLFSGIGGINGQMINNYLGTITGRIGKVFNRSLLYANAGAAVLNTEYNLNGNTGALTLGEAEQNNHSWGWTAGVGIEYAFNSNWFTQVEYDYVAITNQSLAFSSLELINNSSITVDQTLQLFKLGISYKLNA